jgi:hypothetical protein
MTCNCEKTVVNVNLGKGADGEWRVFRGIVQGPAPEGKLYVWHPTGDGADNGIRAFAPAEGVEGGGLTWFPVG